MLLFYLSVIGGENEKCTFEYCYRSYYRQMFCVARGILSNNQDAEDAVHNAFIGIAKHVDVIHSADEDKRRGYCVTAARNAALNIIRTRKASDNIISIDEMYDLYDEQTFEEIIEKAEYQDVLSVIRNMDATYRDVLYLRYVSDLPVKKIASVLDRKVSTVKQQLVRGKKILISALSEEVMTANGK